MKWNTKYEIDIDSEVYSLVNKIDDAVEKCTEEFIADLASRHYSDAIGNGLSVKFYETLEGDILKRALRVIRKRWEENGN